jgi:LysM repeat protein
MSSPHQRRIAAIVGPVLVGAFAMASCGTADDAATQTTIDLSASSTAFVVRPPAPTVPTPEAATAGAVVETEQEYVVQSGDTPIGVANRFGVSLEDLVAYNEWPTAALPFPGETIKIPPGGTVSGAEPAGEAAGTDGGDETDSAEPAATSPDAGDNCAPGSYTIEEGDITRTRVADKFDVTVEALDAANAGTPGYNSFYPGLEIVIPAKDDC